MFSDYFYFSLFVSLFFFFSFYFVFVLELPVWTFVVDGRISRYCSMPNRRVDCDVFPRVMDVLEFYDLTFTVTPYGDLVVSGKIPVGFEVKHENGVEEETWEDDYLNLRFAETGWLLFTSTYGRIVILQFLKETTTNVNFCN